MGFSTRSSRITGNLMLSRHADESAGSWISRISRATSCPPPLLSTAGTYSSGTGKIVRVEGKNRYKEIATGLSLPTAMTFGPDGNLYVSNLGFGPPPDGEGQVLKVKVP